MKRIIFALLLISAVMVVPILADTFVFVDFNNLKNNPLTKGRTIYIPKVLEQRPNRQKLNLKPK